MSVARKCRGCGADVPTNAPFGHCPKCLVELGFGPLPEGLETPCSAPLSSGDAFADYELLNQIGRGGMGVIYKARQITLNRLVAIKLVRPDELPSPALIQRFHLEAEAAASLHHPNIVPIYETGEHQGQHFFSMELIEGKGLDRFIGTAGFAFGEEKTGRARNEQIARIMAKVARAVDYAHQHGVLHRDLKPSNILLDREGEPHLTDFGVAKLIGHTGSGLTASGAIMGTPSYMAPEQAAGKTKRVTTAADTYSLGAILYEMLTGHPPFRADTPVETLKQVVEEEPRHPSTLKDSIDRDLATICMKCLEKEPQRRYPSAAALAEDLERWLRREPILARPAGAWSHCQKWISRNPVVSGLIALFVVTALIGFAGILWQLSEKEQARQRAVAAEVSQRSETARSRAVAEFLKSVLAAAQPSIALGRDTTLLRETLDRANQRILTELKDQPSIGSELLNVVAESYMQLGEFVKAEAAAREGIRLMQSTSPGDHPATALALGILGSVLIERDQIPSALTFAAEALAMNRRLYGTNHINVALALDSLAQAARAKGDLTRAESLTRESLAMLRHFSGNTNLAVARVLTHLGGILRDRRMTVSAVKTLTEGLALHKAILPKDHPEIGTALNELGTGLAAGGDLPQALGSHQQALELFTNTCGPEHPSTGWSLYYVAHTLIRLGDVAQAEPLIEKAVGIAKKAYGPEHRHLAKFLAQAADSFLRVDRLDKARPLLYESLIILRQALGQEHAQVGATLDTLGALLRRQQAWYEMGRLYAEDLPHARVRYAKRGEHLEYHLRVLSDALYSQGRFVEAEPIYREMIARFKGRLPDNSDTRLRAETLFARFLSEWTWSEHGHAGRLSVNTNELTARSREAEDLVRRVITICFAKPETNTARPITLANARSTLGMALVTAAVADASLPLPERESRLREAEGILTAALASQEANRYTYPEELRETLTALVRLSRVWGLVWPAEPEHSKAREWLAKLAVFEGKPTVPSTKLSFPQRPIDLSTNCIDLTAFYTAGLDEDWQRKPWWRTNLATQKKGSLEALLRAPRTLSGIEFDLRGIVQLDSREINRAAPGYPQSVLSIPLGRASRRLHFLHAYGWADQPGTCIATYRINYVDGQQLYLPVLAGEDIGDWQFLGKDPGKGLKRAPIIWTGKNARGFGVRLYLRTWENPRPEIPLKSFDFLSGMTDAAPFLVAVTSEP